MAFKSEDLQVALLEYTKDTLTYIHTVRTFCETSSKWTLHRETELKKLRDIKERGEKLEPKFSDVTQSESKGKAFWQYVKNTISSSSINRRRAELQTELTELLKNILLSLQEISSFLEAVEKLAATSLHVFKENQLLHLPKGVGLDYVQVMVKAAKDICPLVLEFKRDTDQYFLPKLQNVEVLAYQLDRYIQTTSSICEKFGKSCFSGFDLEKVGETVVDLSADLPEEDIQRMLDHINQLVKIRNDPHFRMAFLFQQKPGQDFVTEFKERQPRMLTFLKDLEETAVQLDRMNKGARISTVAGSSVGAIGGILSIVGLALIPVTAGVSLSLTLAGVGLGVTSGVNGIVTTATEMGVNATQQKKAGNYFQSFMDDVQSLQNCVDEAEHQAMSKIKAILKEVEKESKGVAGEEFFNFFSKTFRIGSMADDAFKLRGVASGIGEIGEAAAKNVRVGAITLNALFLGMDVFMICKTSMDLAKGNETQMSKFIRARAELWSSVMDSWQKMFDSLVEGLTTFEKKEAVLETPFNPETPFYPETPFNPKTEMKKQRETKVE